MTDWYVVLLLFVFFSAALLFAKWSDEKNYERIIQYLSATSKTKPWRSLQKSRLEAAEFYPSVLGGEPPQTLAYPCFRRRIGSCEVWAFLINRFRHFRLCAVIKYSHSFEGFVVQNRIPSLTECISNAVKNVFLISDGDRQYKRDYGERGKVNEVGSALIEEVVLSLVRGKPILSVSASNQFLLVDGRLYPRSARDYEDFLNAVEEFTNESLMNPAFFGQK